MWLNKRNTQIAIGLIVLCLVLATTIPQSYHNEFLVLMRELQLAATLALFFGIFKAHSKHKATFLLLWLVLTVLSGLSMLKAGCNYWPDNYRYNESSSTIWALLSWALAVGVFYFWTLMYTDYVELTVGAKEQGAEVVNAEPADDVVKTPAPCPNLDNLTVLVHGKRMQQ